MIRISNDQIFAGSATIISAITVEKGSFRKLKTILR